MENPQYHAKRVELVLSREGNTVHGTGKNSEGCIRSEWDTTGYWYYVLMPRKR